MCSRQFWGAWAHAWAGVAPAVPSEKLAVSWSDTQVHDQGRPGCARAHCTSNRPSATTWRPSTVAGCVQDRSAWQALPVAVCDVGLQLTSPVASMLAVGSQLVTAAAHAASSGTEATSNENTEAPALQ